LETTFSAAALAAPAFVGLGRFSGSRGRVEFGGQEFAIGEIGAEDLARTALPDAIPIAVSHGDQFEIARDLHALGPDGRALLLFPTAPFREGKDTLAAAAERFLQRS
jgi:hypothetical protein